MHEARGNALALMHKVGSVVSSVMWGRDAHSEHSILLHIVKTGRITLFLVAGFARVAIKNFF